MQASVTLISLLHIYSVQCTCYYKNKLPLQFEKICSKGILFQQDQFDNIDKHHQYGIDFAERYSKFIKERCAIESEYASKLRKLVKNYQPKKKDEERSMYDKIMSLF